jgi:hypothetical protein
MQSRQGTRGQATLLFDLEGEPTDSVVWSSIYIWDCRNAELPTDRVSKAIHFGGE